LQLTPKWTNCEVFNVSAGWEGLKSPHFGQLRHSRGPIPTLMLQMNQDWTTCAPNRPL